MDFGPAEDTGNGQGRLSSVDDPAGVARTPSAASLHSVGYGGEGFHHGGAETLQGTQAPTLAQLQPQQPPPWPGAGGQGDGQAAAGAPDGGYSLANGVADKPGAPGALLGLRQPGGGDARAGTPVTRSQQRVRP
jgi:hypothetical protein